MLPTITITLVSGGLIGLYLWQRKRQAAVALIMQIESDNGMFPEPHYWPQPFTQEEAPLIHDRRKSVRRTLPDRREKIRFEARDRRYGMGRRKEDKMWHGGYTY